MEFIQIYICVNVFIIGTLFGSFFSLANYRIPRKKDIVFTRSFCPKCNHNLGFFDLIPILSFVFHGGKCKYCKEKISIRYPLLEISTGIIFLTIYMIFGFSIYSLILVGLYIYFNMLTGCYLNKKKMINEELEKLNMTKLNKKAGVFITEVIIGAVIFAMSIGMSYASYRNAEEKKNLNIAKSNAMFECTRNVEIALGLDYEDVNNFVTNITINGTLYTTKVEVSKYSDSFINKEDLLKIVSAETTYTYKGVNYNYKLETIKKR